MYANVFFPCKRNYLGAFYHDKHAFMNFRRKDFSLYDKPYGENDHYSTSVDNIHTYYEIRSDFDNKLWNTMSSKARKFFMVCLYYDFMSLAGKQLEIESKRLQITIHDTRKHLLKIIFDFDSQYGEIYNEMSVIFGSIVALINQHVQFQSDKDNWFQTQANISLSLLNTINDEYQYNFNDTQTLMRRNATITRSSYESPRNERRVRDEQDMNVSIKKRKLMKEPVRS